MDELKGVWDNVHINTDILDLSRQRYILQFYFTSIAFVKINYIALGKGDWKFKTILQNSLMTMTKTDQMIFTLFFRDKVPEAGGRPLFNLGFSPVPGQRYKEGKLNSCPPHCCPFLAEKIMLRLKNGHCWNRNVYVSSLKLYIYQIQYPGLCHSRWQLRQTRVL